MMEMKMKKLLTTVTTLVLMAAAAHADGLGAHGGEGGGLAMLDPGDSVEVMIGWTCTNPYRFTVRVEGDHRGAMFDVTDDDGKHFPLRCARTGK
jgi:hypothetical protein